ncbi:MULTISPECIES: preprotein translocase subunit SecD [Methanobacterium]|mgnify:FL=1|jgi:preprotein translocase subunit SecD|uniref:Protein-export membrane protein SecD n=1 Tax=Methanobacterium formicicum TaxID=2162 RepID=A0A090JWU9_METFO|nr:MULTISPECIES: preprotein translocase subunit SecD [Methanobacterium]KUK72590.1 MAG: Protein-export membrane protein SecD [Methanobacterium sp. 42_16]MDH2658356.1 preprotein translocase subunit SecD [Methanobacterium formicicum]CEA14006.1 Protein-export membrane protein SecD [Methanobacterium formicicum]
MNIKEFLKDKQVLLLVVLLIASIGAISYLGIQQGLDLKGGSTIQLQLEQPVDTATMNTVTAVLDKRLNIFGVKDVKVYPSGNQNVIVEIAGVQPDDVTKIVGSNGKFEAKINNQTALVGSDITQVKSYQVTGTKWEVPFTVSLEGANRFAKVAQGQAGVPVEMYLDDQLITSPELSAELANGQASTDVMISGSEATKEEAQSQAKSIQTLLQSGALPVKVKIVGISSVSADLGDQFINGALIAGILALLVIAAIIIVRYRSPLLVIPIMLTSIAELILVLGAAAVVHWNIDLAAIAGILAAIGTGVDDQIIITDEVLKGFQEKKRISGVRRQIKKAFFIIFASAGTLVAAMLPLAYIGFSRGATGIGILSGFAFTTILGVLIGIFITRPVYAKFVEMVLDK